MAYLINNSTYPKVPIMSTLAIILISTLIFVLVVFCVNRWIGPRATCQTGNLSAANSDASNSIRVTTWNIGFGALGAKADIVMDGGQNLRALSKKNITFAATRIAQKISEISSDVYLVQEIAGPSFLTRTIDVKKRIEQQLNQYSYVFWADLKTHLIPKPFNFNHGMSIFSRLKSAKNSVLRFPQDPLYYYGFLKKYYGGMVQRYTMDHGKDWVVINIHLSAYDKGGFVRKKQLNALFSYATEQYQQGHYVVIGGDWNMKLLSTEFPFKSPDKQSLWSVDFPTNLLPKDWKVVTDHTTPTVRTLHQPYIQSDNYTCIIDGFIVSPNVQITDVKTHDLSFEHTDHHPVSAIFTVKE